MIGISGAIKWSCFARANVLKKSPVREFRTLGSAPGGLGNEPLYGIKLTSQPMLRFRAEFSLRSIIARKLAPVTSQLNWALGNKCFILVK